MRAGEKLLVIGRKGQGSSSFVKMLVGNLKKIRGGFYLNGRVAYIPDKPFFSNATL